MPFRFVFEVRVRPGEDEAFIKNWREGSIPIQKYPGARGTRLHKKRGEDHTYIAIAEWESKEARVKAYQEIRANRTALAQEVNKSNDNGAYGEVIIIGELDEIDYVAPS